MGAISPNRRKPSRPRGVPDMLIYAADHKAGTSSQVAFCILGEFPDVTDSQKIAAGPQVLESSPMFLASAALSVLQLSKSLSCWYGFAFLRFQSWRAEGRTIAFRTRISRFPEEERDPNHYFQLDYKEA